MIVLCTETPLARQDGERIIVSFPSGSETIELALSLNQAMHLWRSTREAANLGFGNVSTRGGADLLQFRDAND